jgi:surface antigen
MRTLLTIVVTSGLGGWAFAGTALAGGAPNLVVWANSTASDESVAAIVEVRAEPAASCAGDVHKGSARRGLPVQVITKSGAGRWEWRINGRVGPGRWIARVSCRGKGWTARTTRPFPAVAGVGPGSAAELFVPNSLTVGAVSRPPSHGVGSGAESLYPLGQCTWWVARLRPDLPWFPGSEGNAANWAAAAQKRHIATGTVPEVGAVAVFAPGQYGASAFGHLAYVTGVNAAPETIEVSESNFTSPGVSDTRTVSSLGLVFIYRGAAPAAISPPLSAPHASEPPTTAPPIATTFAETTGGSAHTWTDYRSAGGVEGVQLPANYTVAVTCRVVGFQVEDGDAWWYRIASSPWNDRYYATADAFYNDGSTAGPLIGTPLFDPNVPLC